MNAVSQKPDAIRSMFAAIARRYDLLNHLLSLGTDIYWRQRVVRELTQKISRHPILTLDLCCGTADLALAVSRLGWVVGCDFCHPMLTLARRKIQKKQKSHIIFLSEGDALNLPFRENTFDVITIGFGLRNLADPPGGLREMRRVLRPGGQLVVLEFSKPVVPGLRGLFGFYFSRILPLIGRLVSGQSEAYTYLPASVESFADQPRLKQIMQEIGFQQVHYKNLTGGIAALHMGRK